MATTAEITLIALLLVSYLAVLLVVLFFLIRRSIRSKDEDSDEEAHNKTRFIRRSPCMKLKQPDMIPYKYELVKTQLPVNEDEQIFYATRSAGMSSRSLWSSASGSPSYKPIHERRNLPTLFVDCYNEDKVQEKWVRKKSATDELKENSTNEFRKESLYKTFNDLENNELKCFDQVQDCGMSMINEHGELASPLHSNSTSSSRSGSEKRRSPFRKKLSENTPFRKKSDSSSFKNKLKIKKNLGRTKSNEHF